MRSLVVLHFGHGVGYPELADSFGIGQGAVRMRVSRALARMRDVLRDDEDRATGRFAAIDAEASGAFPREADDLAEAFDDLELDFDEAVSTSDGVFEDPGEPTFEALRDHVSYALWSQLEQLAARIV